MRKIAASVSEWPLFAPTYTAVVRDGRAYRPCAEANLGGDLSSAQLKREHLHLQLLGAAPADADWFVTTEQDVWWHAARLHAYLEAIERKFPDAHAAPFFAGGYEGPFLVMNRRFVEAVVGNATFVDRCRAALLEFLAQPHVHPHKGDKGDTGGKRRLGGRAKCHRADGSSCAAEAPYNNDLLVRWCAQRSGGADGDEEGESTVAVWHASAVAHPTPRGRNINRALLAAPVKSWGYPVSSELIA